MSALCEKAILPQTATQTRALAADTLQELHTQEQKLNRVDRDLSEVLVYAAGCIADVILGFLLLHHDACCVRRLMQMSKKQRAPWRSCVAAVAASSSHAVVIATQIQREMQNVCSASSSAKDSVALVQTAAGTPS